MILRNTNLVVENLYYLLWLKDSGLKEASFSVKIPDSVVIQSGKILNWFFSSKNGEGVLMKKEVNLKNTLIYESFLAKASRSGIVACFIENLKNENADLDSRKTFLTSHLLKEESKLKFDIPKNEGEISVRYLTKEKLKEFLFTDVAENKTGILQQFIDPYSDSQAIIQAIWSPQLCIFSKRVNNKHLFDKRYDPYERATTFDGAEVFSRTVPLRGKMISQEMRKFCENIVHRISHVTFQKVQIQRMVVYFKMDEKNCINFLYCSSMRLSGEKIDPDILDNLKNKIQNTPLILDTNYVKPEEIKLIYTTNTMRPVHMENDIKCFHCQDKIQAKDLVPVTYEFIINNFEENPKQQYSKVSNVPVIEASNGQDFVLEKPQDKFVKDKSSEIPKLIAKLYPKLNVENYRKFRTSKKFLSQKYCYLDFSRYVKMSGAPLKGVQDFTFMKQGLSKRGSLFTREMKAIIAAKNVEMTEQKGSELVRGQDRDVYQKMLLHLVEEMQRIEREQKRKSSSVLGEKQEKKPPLPRGSSQEDLSSAGIPSTRCQSAATNVLSRPQSCLQFDPSLKLKAIQKEIAQIDTKNSNKSYVDASFLNANAQDPIQQQSNLINPPFIQALSQNYSDSGQLQMQYKLNENFIKTKKMSLNLQSTSLSNSSSTQPNRMQLSGSQASTLPSRQLPLSATSNSSKYNLFTTSSQARPQSGTQFFSKMTSPASNSIQEPNNNYFSNKQLMQKPTLSDKYLKTLPPPHQYLANLQQNPQKQADEHRINYSLRSLEDVQKTRQAQEGQKIKFSTLTRPQSHYLFSTNPKQQDEPVPQSRENYQNQFEQQKKESPPNKRVSEPIDEIGYDDELIEDDQQNDQLDSIEQEMWRSIDFNIKEINDEYLNQGD